MAAAKKKTEVYKSKAITSKIIATSRISKKIGETYYTLEFTEERIIPEDADVVKEREILWDVVNGEVDKQIEDVYKLLKK